MSGQHTPGPWNSAHFCGRAYVVKCAGGTYHIGTIRGKENARLVAAAPELLEALLELDAKPEHTSSWLKAQAAIAKATGGAA